MSVNVTVNAGERGASAGLREQSARAKRAAHGAEPS